MTCGCNSMQSGGRRSRRTRHKRSSRHGRSRYMRGSRMDRNGGFWPFTSDSGPSNIGDKFNSFRTELTQGIKTLPEKGKEYYYKGKEQIGRLPGLASEGLTKGEEFATGAVQRVKGFGSQAWGVLSAPRGGSMKRRHKLSKMNRHSRKMRRTKRVRRTRND